MPSYGKELKKKNLLFNFENFPVHKKYKDMLPLEMVTDSRSYTVAR